MIDAVCESCGTEYQAKPVDSHRLLCGDAFIEADHDRALGGAIPDAVITDPPYGVGLTYDGIDDAWPLIKRVIEETMPLCLRAPVVAITTGVRWLWRYPEPTWLLAWVHPAPMGLGPWGWTGLNPILVYGSDPYLKRGMGSRADTLVLAADRDGVEGHPAPKPLEVWKWLMQRCSPATDELIFDPFMGSGTTIVAAEELGRVACGLEISPAYCDVAVRRWETISSRRAVLAQ